MKRRRSPFHPPASPRDAEREGDTPHFETVEDLDSFFRCRHGFELGLGSKCLTCIEEQAERRAERYFDELEEEL